MIALALGLAIVAAVGTLSVNATRSYRSMNRASEQIENGRYALKLIKDEIEHAGFFGFYPPPAKPLTTLANPCEKSASNFYFSLEAPVFWLSETPTCIKDRIPLTDFIVSFRASTKESLVTGESISSDNTYIQTTPMDYIIGTNCSLINSEVQCLSIQSNKSPPPSTLNLTKPPDNSIAPIRQLHGRIYYIRSYSQNGDGIPTLATKAPSDGDNDAHALVEGIENMRFQFGIDENQDGSPDKYSSSPSLTAWSNVVTVRINLLARSLERDPRHADKKTYELGEGMKGTIGIIGPKRMDYDKVIGTLRTVQNQLDDLYRKE